MMIPLTLVIINRKKSKIKTNMLEKFCNDTSV